MNRLTIVIPTYKKPRSLHRLLSSIRRNTQPKFTDIIVVVDDVNDYQNNIKLMFPGIIYVKSGGSRTGFVNTVWKGVLMSDTEYIGFLGDDCEVLTHGIDEMIIERLNRYSFMTAGLNDGIQEGRAHPFMRRDKWIDGGGYPPCYCHYYGDTELYKITKYHGNWSHIEEAKIIHHHEYAKRKGIDGVDIMESTQAEGKEAAKGDGAIHQIRMAWWEKHCKPVKIPWNII